MSGLLPAGVAVAAPALAHLPAFDVQGQVARPLVIGLFQGSVFGLIALGIVLLYKSNRIFNFAQAEFGTLAALTTYLALNGKLLGIPWHAPYPVAAFLGVVVGTLSAVVAERLVIRPLFDRPKVILVVGTVGVLLLLVAVEGLFFTDLRSLPTINAPGQGALRGLHDPAATLGFAHDYRMSWQQVLCFVVLVALALASVAFFRYSRTGTAILAVSQEPVAAEVVGISVGRISLITWTIAGFLGAVAGVIVAPGISGPATIGPGAVTGLTLISGLTAAVIGGITSLPGAFLGGIVVGELQAIAAADVTSFPGSEGVTVGVVLLLALLLRPQGLLGKEA